MFRILSMGQWWGQQLQPITLQRRIICVLHVSWWGGAVKCQVTAPKHYLEYLPHGDWKILQPKVQRPHKRPYKSNNLVKYAHSSKSSSQQGYQLRITSCIQPANKKIRIEEPEVSMLVFVELHVTSTASSMVRSYQTSHHFAQHPVPWLDGLHSTLL